jgi:hypothetical protein
LLNSLHAALVENDAIGIIFKCLTPQRSAATGRNGVGRVGLRISGGEIGRLHPFNGLEKHALAEVVQTGVRLVQYDEMRVAKKSPRKTEASTKPAPAVRGRAKWWQFTSSAC